MTDELQTMCPNCGATEQTGVTCRMCGYPDRKPGDPNPPGFVEEMERRRKRRYTSNNSDLFLANPTADVIVRYQGNERVFTQDEYFEWVEADKETRKPTPTKRVPKPDPRVTVPTPRQSKTDPRRTHGG